MESYAERFRSLFPKKKIKQMIETPSDDQEVIYIKNLNKYKLIDLNDWFNIQQKQIEKNRISPPDKSLRNCEVIIHNQNNDTANSQLIYSSPLNELYPLNKYQSDKDIVRKQANELKTEKDREPIYVNNEKENNNDNIDIIIDNNNNEIIIKEENEYDISINNINSNNNENKNKEINERKDDYNNLQMNDNWNKDKKQDSKKESDDINSSNHVINKETIDNNKVEGIINDIDYNITEDQMEDFQMEVNKIKKKIQQKNNQAKQMKFPIKHKMPIIKSQINQFIRNNHKKNSQNNNTYMLENDDKNTTQSILNNSKHPLLYKFNKDNQSNSNSEIKAFNYDSSFSTQIPYQISIIDPVYHYGDFSSEPLIKKIKLFLQQSNLNNNRYSNNQLSFRMNARYQDTFSSINRHRSLSKSNNDLTTIKKTESKTKENEHDKIIKTKKELLYYKEFRENLNKLNEEYIANYRKLHPKEFQNQKKAKEIKVAQFSSINHRESIIDDTPYQHNHLSILLPIIKKPLSHSASQVLDRKLSISKSNSDLRCFLFEHKPKGRVFSNFQTFNSKIEQIRSFLKK